MNKRLRVGFAAILLSGLAAAPAAVAQVAYRHYVPTPADPLLTPFGYPVPGGFLQPDETLITTPSFVVSTNPGAPGVAVEQRCQYPNGWNVTDYGRELNGIPNGIDHSCPVDGPR